MLNLLRLTREPQLLRKGDVWKSFNYFWKVGVVGEEFCEFSYKRTYGDWVKNTERTNVIVAWIKDGQLKKVENYHE